MRHEQEEPVMDPRGGWTEKQVAEATGVDVSDVGRNELDVCTIDGMMWWEWFLYVKGGEK
jgi:hypothetical protein